MVSLLLTDIAYEFGLFLGGAFMFTVLFILVLGIFRCDDDEEALESQNDEFNYGHNVDDHTLDGEGDIEI